MIRVKSRLKAALYAMGPGRFYAPAYKRLAEQVAVVDGPLLDVGCGTGAFLGALSSLVPEMPLLGIDRNLEAVTRCREEYSSAPNLRFECMEAEQLSLDSGSYGCAVAMQNLMHWKRPLLVLSNVYSVLRPGGKVWLLQADPELPIPDGWIDRRYGWPTDAILRARWERYRPSRGELEAVPAWLEQVGFEGVETGSTGFYSTWTGIKKQ